MLSAISTPRYHIRNLWGYTTNPECNSISNMATKADIVVVRFDPEGFAKWLTNAYENVCFPPKEEVAGSNPAASTIILVHFLDVY